MTDLIEVPPERPHSGPARLIDRLIRLCAILPYSAVALLLRVVIARAFFSAGQEMAAGPAFALAGHEVLLPLPLREEALRSYEAAFASVNIPPALIAYAAGLCEFVLPVLLVLGLATRFAALVLVLLTIMLGHFIAPGSFWPLHAYWYAILLVLLSCGAGTVSADFLIRRLYER
ncbi:MAG TPA: DoxX family membrane protein [Pseudorhodoplanes sp.]|nr:DoxX family membrane protein [Pseudorhodoplanes sp.]